MRIQSDRTKELSRMMRLNLPRRTDPCVYSETGDATTKAMADAVKDKREQLVCGRVDKTIVALGSSMAEYNKEYCADNNITVLHSPNPVGGGAVVFSAGDLTFSFITKDLQSAWLGEVQKAVCDYLISKGLNAAIDGNDILIDGKKISGSSGGVYGGMRTNSLFIAVTSSAELVEKICLKKSGKKPASLQEFGITAQEIQDVVVGSTKRFTEKTERGEQRKPHGRRTLKDVLGNTGNTGAERLHNELRRFKDRTLRAQKKE